MGKACPRESEDRARAVPTINGKAGDFAHPTPVKENAMDMPRSEVRIRNPIVGIDQDQRDR